MEQELSSPTTLSDSFQDILQGLNSPGTEQNIGSAQWTLGASNGQAGPGTPLRSPVTTQSPIVPSSSSPRSGSRPHMIPSRRTTSSLQEQNVVAGESPQSSSQLNPPHRSIFASGPPTSSVSANTAHASISTSSGLGSSRPLAALTGTGINRRSSRNADLSGTPVPGTEKDVDDLDIALSPPGLDSALGSTSQKLSSLFVSETETPGPLSRDITQLRSLSNIGVGRTSNDSLTGHLLYNGFISGRHSDITVHAFGQSYKLHKLLLDRAPFFSSAFSGPWAESSAREMSVVPEDIDPNITKTAFELALKRLYGTAILAHEEQEAVGLFATACWLDMLDLVDSCVDYILRQMHPSKLHALIRLVTNNYYGKAGDRILASSKAMLCREGWEMPYEYWDEIPAEIVREIIGGDAFYVPGEWERWFLALKLLNRRLRNLAITNGLVSPEGLYIHPKPQNLRFFTVRPEIPYRRDVGLSSQQQWSEKDEVWHSLYTSPEVSPLLTLLNEGIHYVHLRFEQLQQIRSAKDILGVAVLPDKVISDALWMSMELRQRVLNAHDGDLELGLSELAEDFEEVEEDAIPSEVARGKQKEGTQTPQLLLGEIEPDTWDGNGQPRKFWIPTNDVSCIMGGAREAVATPSATSSGDWTTAATRLSASLEPTDVAWAADFAGSLFEGNSAARNLLSTSSPRFSHYPPFRFCAEFPNPRTLKEKKRVYSQTVWYAGSMWNLYIQRVNTSKNQQLGIYLHRAKDKDPSDDPLAQFVPASVDDRIGQLEREIIMRKTERRRHWREEVLASGGDPDQDTSNLTQELERISSPESSDILAGGRLTSIKGGERGAAHKTSQTPAMPAAPSQKRSISAQDATMLPLESEEEDAFLIRTNQKFSSAVATMPPYIDSRSTIKTYFKIYSPSKAGRLLSVYESAPDSFNFGKSWGWKSSQMVLDDGLGGYEKGSAKDGKLRYMVVIGNV